MLKNTPANQAFAEAIADGLDDKKSLPMFAAIVRRYPREVIRKAYEEALGYPAEKIRKSRGAIFIYLVKKYANDDNQQRDA
jgi:hypothetical protein